MVFAMVSPETILRIREMGGLEVPCRQDIVLVDDVDEHCRTVIVQRLFDPVLLNLLAHAFLD